MFAFYSPQVKPILANSLDSYPHSQQNPVQIPILEPPSLSLLFPSSLLFDTPSDSSYHHSPVPLGRFQHDWSDNFSLPHP